MLFTYLSSLPLQLVQQSLLVVVHVETRFLAILLRASAQRRGGDAVALRELRHRARHLQLLNLAKRATSVRVPDKRMNGYVYE